MKRHPVNLSRRLLIGLLFFGGGGAIGGCTRAFETPASVAPTPEHGLAIQLYSFHRELERDLPGTLRRIKALGFDRVETYPLKDTNASQLRAALDEAGLKAVSAHMPWERITTDIAGVIADVRVLGAEQFGPGSINLFDGRPFRNMNLAEAEEAGAHLKRACAAARQAKLRVFIHTHGNELARAGDTTALDRMLRAAGNCFEIEADITWIKWAGVDPAGFIRRYGQRVRSLHIKDIAAGGIGQAIGSIDPAQFTALGQGSVCWPGVLRAARWAGVRHYIIEDESADPARQIPQSLRYLESIAESDDDVRAQSPNHCR